MYPQGALYRHLQQTVGEDLTQEDIKAAFNDGVLKLIVPKEIKKVEEEPKFITIE